MQKYNHWFPKLINVNAIVLFQTIYYAMSEKEVTDRLRRHEEVHVKQQQELGSIKFKLLYLLEWLKNLIKYRNFNKAYWYISYEIEARRAE